MQRTLNCMKLIYGSRALCRLAFADIRSNDLTGVRLLRTSRAISQENVLLSGNGQIHQKQVKGVESSSSWPKGDSDVSPDTLTKAREVYDLMMEKALKKHSNMSPLTIKCNSVQLEVVEFLINEKVTSNVILDTLTGNMSLAGASLSNWKSTIYQLRHYNFRPVHFLPIITKCPKLLSSDSEAYKALHNIISWLRDCRISESQSLQMIARNPDLILADYKELKHNYNNLSEVFTRADVTKLVTSHSIVLTTSWEVTALKLDYVLNSMGIKDNRKLLKSAALWREPLLRLALRHDFLYRRGLYARPNKRGLGGENNPELREITDTDNKSFAVLVANASEEEFSEFIIKNTKRIETILEENRARLMNELKADDDD